MQTGKTKIERAAHNMIARFGDDALKEVDKRIAELESQGEAQAQELWREIRSIVKLLLNTPKGETKH